MIVPRGQLILWEPLGTLVGGLITYDFYKLPLGEPAGILMMERHLHPKLIKIKVGITNIFEIRAVWWNIHLISNTYNVFKILLPLCCSNNG